MTDRTNHRREAERMLADADEWARQAGELSPKASERACLAYAAVHALLAIHDTLTAADRYAANEERQREIIADYAGQPVCGRCGRDAQGREWPNCSDLAKDGIDRKKAHDATCERYWGHGQDWVCDECEAEMREGQMDDAWQSRDWETVSRLQDEAEQQEEAAKPDPLDENDHRDRLDADGDRWVHTSRGCWHIVPAACAGGNCRLMLAYISEVHGPLIFAPDATQEAVGGDLSAPEGESGAEERGEAEEAVEPLWCPRCGHDIDEHGWEADYAITCCLACDDHADCRKAPSDIARALIERAAEQAGGGHV